MSKDLMCRVSPLKVSVFVVTIDNNLRKYVIIFKIIKMVFVIGEITIFLIIIKK